MIALVRLGAPVDSPQARAKIARVAEALRDRDVAQVIAYRGDGPPELVSRDGRSTYVAATFRDGADIGDTVARLEARAAREPGVALGGGAVIGEQVGTQVEEDLARAESLAFPILFVVSLFVFRGLVAALLPLVVGMSAILLTFLAMRVVNSVEPMSIFALNLIIGLGLGLAIDYSLFMVSRFREELERTHDTRRALVATMRTAGRTVLFSAVTVAAALSSLLVFPQRFLFSMGIGGALVALVAALVALTLLPALLAVLGPRVNAAEPAPLAGGAAARRRARAVRLLVPALAGGDAPARRRGREHGGAAHPARPAVHRASASPASTPPCCPPRTPRAWWTTRCGRSSPSTAARRCSSRSARPRRPAPSSTAYAERLRGVEGVAAVGAPARAGVAVAHRRGGPRRPPRRARPGGRARRPRRARAVPGARRRLHGGVPRPAGGARRRAARARWRGSP